MSKKELEEVAVTISDSILRVIIKCLGIHNEKT